MSFNGSGTFVVNSSGQPVITGTVISSTAFNALTADLATGLSTCVTKDGQTATTVRVPFAFGINSTLTTDATSATTGSIITAGGISMQKALWVGTTSRHVGATQFDAAITYGGITLSNAVTGTGNMVLGTSPQFTRLVSTAQALAPWWSSFIGVNQVGSSAVIAQSAGVGYFSTNMYFDGTDFRYIGTAKAAYINISAGTFTFRNDNGGSATAGDAFTPTILFQVADGGAATFSSTIASGAITSTGAVTGTLFTPTATGNNGLGLAAANTPALYASTTEVMRSTSTQMTLAVPIAITRTVAGALNSVVSTNADTGTGSYATFQARNLTYVSEMAMFGTGWTTSAQYRQNGAIMEANGPGGIVLSASHASGDLFLYNRNTLALTLGASQAATFSSSVTATSYITSSDYRLKENVQPMIGSLDKISALKPVTYDWISDGSSAGGFIAHELQAVMPNAVVGEKDAVDDKGEIKPQGIDFGKVFPHLVAAIQELTTRLAALESK